MDDKEQPRDVELRDNYKQAISEVLMEIDVPVNQGNQEKLVAYAREEAIRRAIESGETEVIPTPADVDAATARLSSEYHTSDGEQHSIKSDDLYYREVSKVFQTIICIKDGEEGEIQPYNQPYDSNNFNLKVVFKNCIYQGDKTFDLQGVMGDGATWKSEQSLTWFDLLVENSVGNLYAEGHNKLTPEQIFARMAGRKTDSVKLNPATSAAINDSMERLRHCFLEGNYTLYAKNRGNDEALYREFKISGAALPSVRWEHKQTFRTPTGETVEKIVTQWAVFHLPLIYEHSERVGMIQIIKNGMLTIDGIALKATSLQIREYLMNELWRIGAGGHQKTFLSFGTMAQKIFGYDAGMIRTHCRKQYASMKARAQRILHGWLKDGYISFYQAQAERGVVVIPEKLPPKDKRETAGGKFKGKRRKNKEGV